MHHYGDFLGAVCPTCLISWDLLDIGPFLNVMEYRGQKWPSASYSYGLVPNTTSKAVRYFLQNISLKIKAQLALYMNITPYEIYLLAQNGLISPEMGPK